VRALISPEGPSGRVLREAGRYDIVSSPALLDEVVRVLSRTAVRERIAREDTPDISIIIELLGQAELVEPGVIQPVCRDPNDDKLFACAVEAGADYIVSDDKDVLAVGEHGGVRAITTVEFLRLLDEGARP
jgi:putative PIN family toxin of toxin-antitoxin system